MSGTVIAVANAKGGTGKTTAVFLLATELAKRGMKVIIIDADPNHPFAVWEKAGGKTDNLTIEANKGEGDLLNAVNKAKETFDFVLIDLEGTANMTVAYAVASANLVIIPSQSSTLDTLQAANVIRLIKDQSNLVKRDIPFAIVLTRTSPTIRTKGMRQMKESLHANNVETFFVELHEREAFKAMWSHACTLDQLTIGQVSGLEKARENATGFATEVIQKLKAIRESKQLEGAA